MDDHDAMMESEVGESLGALTEVSVAALRMHLINACGNRPRKRERSLNGKDWSKGSVPAHPSVDQTSRFLLR